MRTAEEILKFDLGVQEWLPISFELAVIAINKARKEAIEECAKRATVTDSYQDARRLGLRGDTLNGYVQNNPTKVDKKTILSLINELK